MVEPAPSMFSVQPVVPFSKPPLVTGSKTALAEEHKRLAAHRKIMAFFIVPSSKK
jgi:hypothetical protein